MLRWKSQFVPVDRLFMLRWKSQFVPVLVLSSDKTERLRQKL
jgi:hypothetical protein